MQLKILGCSGGVAAGLRTTSLMIDQKILIDTGTGVGDLTLTQLEQIYYVLLTHSHLDHSAGLPLMLDTLFVKLCKKPLQVFALSDTLDALQKHIFNWVIWPDFTRLPTADSPCVQMHTLKPYERFQLDDYAIDVVPVEHAVPAVGYIIEKAGKRVAFSGDTAENNTFWKALNTKAPVDLLIVECAFPDEEFELSGLAKHYCPSTLMRDLKKLSYRPLIAITHAKPGSESKIMSQCYNLLPDYDILLLNAGHIFDF